MESETHLVRCPEILSEFNLGINVDYMDIYGTLGKQIEAVKIFKKIFRVRTWKLENRKLVYDGPQVHHQSASCAHDDPLPVALPGQLQPPCHEPAHIRQDREHERDPNDTKEKTEQPPTKSLSGKVSIT